jgi:flagellar biosynthesis chaperone FliJ
MTPFRYRLQVLLDQKEREREEAQQALILTQQSLQQEQRELDACRGEQDRAAERLRWARLEMVSPLTGGATGEWIRLKRDHVARLADELAAASDAITMQELRVTEAEEALSGARAKLRTVSRELETLEKHKERQERRFKEEAERKEVAANEEMANTMFLRGKGSR